MTPQKLFCFGHRGAGGHEPENTLRSVRKALQLGADGIEVDVHFADGQLVVIHDHTLDRTTNGRGKVANQSFACLRSLDAGLGEQIPTLSEVFATVNRRATINVELKGPGTAKPVAGLITEFIQHQDWRLDDFLVSSFDLEQLRELKQLNPEIRIGVLISKAPRHLEDLVKHLGPWSLHVNKRIVTSALVTAAHQQRLKVFVFTVNATKEIAHMKNLGVDGVFTDFPEKIVV